MSNPYSAPVSEENIKTTPIIKHSKTPKVMGIIIVILATLGIFGSIAGFVTLFFLQGVMDEQLKMGYSETYIIGNVVFSVLTSFWFLIIGIWLIQYKDIGRRHFNYYTILSVVMVIINFFYLGSFVNDTSQVSEFEMMISRYSSFISVALLLGLFYLLNRPLVKMSLKK